MAKLDLDEPEPDLPVAVARSVGDVEAGLPQTVREEIAIKELGRRSDRLRGVVIGVAVVLGILIGIVVYWLSRRLQFRTLGAHIPYLSALAGAGPALALAFAGRWLARRLVRARRPAWIAELARRYRVARESLADVVGLLD